MLVDVGSEIPILLDLESHTEKKKNTKEMPPQDRNSEFAP